MTLYERLRAALIPVMRFFFRFRVEGLPEPLPDGGLIVSTNHCSNFDALFLAVVLSRPITFMGKESLLKVPVIRRIVRGVDMIPLSRNGGDAAKLRQAVRELKAGKLLVIFPQGTRHRCAPQGTPVKGGLGMMALLSGAKILPGAICTKNYRPRLFGKVVMKFGEAKTYEGVGESKGEQAQSLTQAVFDDICDLASQGEKLL